MKSKTIILFALALSCFNPIFHTSSHAQTNQSSIIPIDEKLTKGKLNNGLTYYILPNKYPAQKAELRLVINAGSLNELEHQRGLAHFLEHMAFNGTKNFPKQTLVDQLQKMGVQFGADLNAYTGFNETVYILPIPLNQPKNLQTGMQILEDWAFHMNLNDEDITQERKIVTEEWRIRTQNPMSEILDKNISITFNNTLFPKRLPIGDIEIINSFAPQTLRDFYKDWYRPELMSIIVVGDVNVSQTKKLIEKHFADKTNPQPSTVRPSVLIPNNQQPLIGVFNHKDLPQSTVYLYQKETVNNHIDKTVEDYQISLKHQIISQIINERLAALQEDEQTPFTMAYSYFGFLDDIGLTKRSFMLVAKAKSGQEEATLNALHTENQRIIQYGLTQTELERASRNLLANIENYFNDRNKVESSDKAEEYVRAAVKGEHTPSIEWEYQATQKYIPSITLSEINQQARNYFTENNRIILINSNQEKNTIKESSIKKIINNQPNTKPNAMTKDNQPLLTTEPKAGSIIKSSYEPSLKITTWHLSNGAVVHFKKTDFKDMIEMSAYSDGGYSQIPNDIWLKTQWAYKGIMEAGVNGHSTTELNKILAGKLIDINPEVNEDSQGLQGAFAPKDIETAFQLIYSQVSQKNHDPAEFNRYVQRGVSQTKNLSNDRMQAFSSHVLHQLNKNNPRFTESYPSLSAWQSIDYEAAYKAYQTLFNNANGMQFTFVGKIDEEQLKPMVERYIASLPSDLNGKLNYQDLGYRTDNTPQTIVFNKGVENLSVVGIDISGDATYNPKEELALMAFGEILTIKLTEHIREVDGGVYNINAHGQMRSRPYGSYSFNISFPADPNKAEIITQNALKELDQLIKQGATAIDLEKFKKTAFISLSENHKKNEFWVDSIQVALKRGQALETILNQEQLLKNLTLTDIQKIGQKYLTTSPVIAILKPETIKQP